MKRDPYVFTDKVLKKLLPRIVSVFSTAKGRLNQALMLDPDNVPVQLIYSIADRLYNDVDRLNRMGYLSVAQEAYKAAYGDIDSLGELEDELLDIPDLFGNLSGLPPDDAFVDEILSGYDPVTGYVYSQEIERKKQRFAEGVASRLDRRKSSGAVLTANGNDIAEIFRVSMRYMLLQSEQYAINVDDAATMQLYKDIGITRVRWNTEKDLKACSVCKKLDGKEFPIDEAPAKAHYNCRCYYTPVF